MQDDFILRTLSFPEDHDIECLIMQWGRNVELLTYWFRWPNSCSTCNGRGMFREYSPHGELWSDVCPDCVDRCICSRCGRKGLDADGNGPCLFCWWDYNDGAPEPWDGFCGCHEKWNIE